ncbi:MAG: gliding motility lipoprotein GldB [Aestuariibaculum sp.]
MKQPICVVIAFVLMLSCKQEDTLESKIAKINIDVKVERFDTLFANVSKKSLTNLKQAYPFMFSEQYTDTFWLDKVGDTLQQELYGEVKQTFGDFGLLEQEIGALYNHLKYYFPHFKVPRVITTTSNVDYRNKVIVADTINLIALDNYLGKDHRFYQNIPVYIRSSFDKDKMVIDLSSEYAKKYIPKTSHRTFLDKMVFYGKILYFGDVMVPFKTEALRVGYSNKELRWVQTNETSIWQYFVEHELLYSTDSKLLGRFINPAPFSKFYIEEIDTESPGRIGTYIGWQIVKAYMENNEVTLNEMLIAPADKIFNKSKFKPRK